MSDLDQMLYELALSANKPRYWANRLRQEVRNLARSAVAYENIGTGISVPWIEAEGGSFDVLPHEAASLRYDTQAIVNGSWVVPTVLSPSGATWEKGMKIDVANGLIHFSGVPKDAVLLFNLYWTFAAHATGNRGLRWKEIGGGSEAIDNRANVGASDPVRNEITHVRAVGVADTTYELAVSQWSGGDLNGDGLMVCVRLR